MEIKGTTTYTVDIFKKVNKFTLYKNKVLNTFLLVCEIFILVVFVFLSIFGGWREDTATMGLLLFFIIFVPAILYISPFIAAKTGKKLYGVENTYIFGDEALTVVQKGETINGSMEIKYSLFKKIYEAVDCYYLYLNSMQVFPLLKSGLEEGREMALNHLLMQKLGNRFITKK